MSLKEQLLRILEQSKATERAFIAGLTNEQRAAAGAFEEWCAKDNVAHYSYWPIGPVSSAIASAPGSKSKRWLTRRTRR